MRSTLKTYFVPFPIPKKFPELLNSILEISSFAHCPASKDGIGIELVREASDMEADLSSLEYIFSDKAVPTNMSGIHVKISVNYSKFKISPFHIGTTHAGIGKHLNPFLTRSPEDIGEVMKAVELCFFKGENIGRPVFSKRPGSSKFFGGLVWELEKKLR